MTIEARIYNGEKTVSSVSGARKAGQLCAKKSEIITFTHTIYKNKLIMDKDLKVRPESLKLLEDNISRTLFDINHKILYDPTPRVMEIKTKINKLDLMKLKSFCTTKETTELQ